MIRHVVRELAEERRAELVAKTGVAAADALFVAWADGETHVPVEPRRAAFARRVGDDCAWACAWDKARPIVVKVEVDGGRAADVGVAA